MEHTNSNPLGPWRTGHDLKMSVKHWLLGYKISFFLNSNVYCHLHKTTSKLAVNPSFANHCLAACISSINEKNHII